MLTWINNTTKQLADETRAKLYVAVTRAEITIGIIAVSYTHLRAHET